MTGIYSFTMRQMRRIVRIPVMVLVLAYHAAVSVPVRYSKKDRKKAIRKMSVHTKGWGRGLIRTFGIKLVIHGDTEKYSGTKTAEGHGGLIISNHMGLMDIFVHAAVFGLRFAAKSEVKSWPVLGWYVDLSLPVWVDRKSRMSSAQTLIDFRETLKDHIPLIVYPEATSTDGFSGLLPFKGTAFETVVGTDLYIQPLITIYKPSKGAMMPSWYGDAELLPHLWDMLGNGKVEAHIYIMDPVRCDGRDRKQLSRDLHESMTLEYNKRLSEIYPERMKNEQ